MKKGVGFLAAAGICALIFLFAPDGLKKNESMPKPEADDCKLSVHCIDVGQGDSTLIKLPDGQNVLIDAGEKDSADRVVEYLNSEAVEKIDYLIGTHPHSDHIGGLSDVINSFEIGKLYMPKVGHTSKTFENLLDTIEEKNVDVYTAKAGVVLYEDDETRLYMVAPVSDEYEELNDYSAVVKLIYKETSFLFMGDAEQLSENEITEDVRADVLRIGHHGSNTSSSKEFLYRVMPKTAVISVGAGNTYGHPAEAVINRLSEVGAEIFRTDNLGDIVIMSNGAELFIYESR